MREYTTQSETKLEECGSIAMSRCLLTGAREALLNEIEYEQDFLS